MGLGLGLGLQTDQEEEESEEVNQEQQLSLMPDDLTDAQEPHSDAILMDENPDRFKTPEEYLEGAHFSARYVILCDRKHCLHLDPPCVLDLIRWATHKSHAY